MKYAHLTETLDQEFIFSPDAVEILILDRLGHIVWKMSRGSPIEPIHWEGIDLYGMKVETGSYTCKIIYTPTEIYYVPFVFMKR